MINELTSNHTARILIFDSGVGGLSILQEIQQQYPSCLYFYGSDNAVFPYGTKSEDFLISRVDEVLHRMQEESQADIIVVACNTASTVALPRIRERFKQPVIGVVPAVKPAAKISKTKTIGLLATPGTVKRSYTQQLIDDFAHDCQIIRVGSSELVQLAEDKLAGKTISSSQLKSIIQPFLENMSHPDNDLQLDTVILACTHFPLLKTELKRVLPDVSFWVDSGDAIARRVGHFLQELSLLEYAQPEVANGQIRQSMSPQALLTKRSSLQKALTSFGIHQVSYVDI